MGRHRCVLHAFALDKGWPLYPKQLKRLEMRPMHGVFTPFEHCQAGYEEEAAQQRSGEWQFFRERRSKLPTRYCQLRRMDAQLYGGRFV